MKKKILIGVISFFFFMTTVQAVTPDFSSVTIPPYPVSDVSSIDNPVIDFDYICADPFLFKNGTNEWYSFYE